MANANVIPQVTETRTVVTQEARVVLDLSVNEAKAVRMLFGYIYGDLSQAVYDAADEALKELGHPTSGLHDDDGLDIDRGERNRIRGINSPAPLADWEIELLSTPDCPHGLSRDLCETPNGTVDDPHYPPDNPNDEPPF